jgi:hypothetical protein
MRVPEDLTIMLRPDLMSSALSLHLPSRVTLLTLAALQPQVHIGMDTDVQLPTTFQCTLNENNDHRPACLCDSDPVVVMKQLDSDCPKDTDK